MPEYRLGDDIDDFCVRCKRLMNHLVVSVMNGGPAKVRCRTCHSDHDYRHEQAPPPKVDSRKQALFNEVLKKANPQATEVAVAAEDPLVEPPRAGAAAAAVAEKPKAVAPRAAAEPKPKAKTAAKVKAKTKARK